MSDSISDFQLQSYIFTAARYNFSVYEKRIIYRMIEIEQKMIDQEKIIKSPHKVETNLWGDRKYTFPVQYLLSAKDIDSENDETSKSKNNVRIIKALKDLKNKTINKGVPDGKSDYWEINLISSLEFVAGERFVTWKADSKLIEMIMDFSKGWRAYELKIAFNLQSRYAMRFYELIANKDKPIEYKTIDLIKMFGIEDKYTRKKDGIVVGYIYKNIEKYVIKKAQEELDKISPYTFNYKFSKDYQVLTIVPIYQPQFASAKFTKAKERKIDLSKVLTENEYKTYIDEFGFTEQGLKNNYELFLECKRSLPENYSFFLFQEIRSALGKKRGKVGPGYIISIIKNQLEQWKAK